MKYHLITYGCQMNVADSEEMAQPLRERGLVRTLEPDDADVLIMNTCTVREHAEHKAISNLGRLRDWKRENPDRLLIVAGCAASLWGDSLKKKYPFVDLVSPATQIENFPEAIAQVLKDRWNWGNEAALFRPRSEVRGPEIGVGRRTSDGLFGNESTAYITIMRGCNLACSYCIVPQVRGREKYRPVAEILSEIQKKVAEGYREVMLLGQTVNSYYYRTGVSEYRSIGVPEYRSTGVPEYRSNEVTTSQLSRDTVTPLPRYPDTVVDFADLLRAVNALPGVELIRFMSPHPVHMRERVVEAIQSCEKVARHVHLPVQSGSSAVLSRMKRLYSREDYLDVVRRLRKALPGISLTTDIIVGYPGESDEDFDESLSLIEEVRFNGLFAFQYSPRPGTTSAQEPDDVSQDIKESRLQKVLSLNLSLNADKAIPKKEAARW